jgi:hypothetical protein
MWSLNRRACAPLALLALASLAGPAPAAARGERGVQERHEQRPSDGPRQSARREGIAQQGHRTQAARAQSVHAGAKREASEAHAHAGANYHREPDHHRETGVRKLNERRPADGGVRETQLSGGGRLREVSRGLAGNQAHVVGYGKSVSGTVERTIRPGLVSRTFVGGGHVLYSRVYQQHVWHQFGRSFAYETFVPGVRYPGVYYTWALGAWPRPVVYSWGWQAQPWYPAYGVLFTPYPVYTSPDLWMTDYIIARSMQTAYQSQTAPPAAQPIPAGVPAAPAPDASAAAPVPPPDSSPAPQPSLAGDVPPAPQPSDAAPAQSGGAPAAPTAAPPAITPQIKAQLNTQIKVQLREQQAAAATPASLTNESTPPALRPNHVFFEVVHPIDVPSGTAKGYCSVSANDYIKRTGAMSQDDWKVPVVVELSGPSDCPQGLRTRIGLNDLNGMENEQEARVMEAMQAASPSLGPNGPPAGAHPTLIVDGSAAPDPMALSAIRQAQ